LELLAKGGMIVCTD